MNYTKAKLIIWNPNAYTKSEVRNAAVFILGSMGAHREDVDQATNLI